MEKTIKLLNKFYPNQLSKTTDYKKNIVLMKDKFTEFNIPFTLNNEYDYYRNQVIYNSILNKQKFEDTFLVSCVNMNDYWNDLDYDNRRRLLNVDIDLMKSNLNYIPYQGQNIYVPIFDLKLNSVYDHDMILYTLKQYYLLKKDFKDKIDVNTYDYLPYLYNFSEAKVIYHEASSYVLFNSNNAKMYLIVNNNLKYELSFQEPSAPILSLDIYKVLAEKLLNEDETVLIDMIISNNLVSPKLTKKLEKLLSKLSK
ncbi:MAG: hypothetical protein RSG07_01125 [Erysipelotrichaceae bacterium]